MVQIMAQCQEENVLTEFMEHYGTELIEMLFKELTREEDLEISRLDGYDAGQKDGFTKGETAGLTKGAAQEKREIARNLMQLGLDLSQIRQATGLIAEEMEKLSRCRG